MSGVLEYPCWGEAKQVYLRSRSDHLLGPARETTSDHDEVGFRVTYLPNGEIVVTLTETCCLRLVHVLCELIGEACLDRKDGIDFTRDPAEADTRLQTFGK